MDGQEGLTRRSQRTVGSPPRAEPPGKQPTDIHHATAGPDARAPRDRPDRRPARVLLVADDALHRYGLRALLDSQPGVDVVGEAPDCFEAAECLRRVDPSVVLLDPRGLATSPLAAIRALSRCALLVLASPGGEPVEEAAALGAGASGLLLTTATPEELAAALRIVVAGYTLHLPPRTDRVGGEDEPPETAPKEAPTGFLNLTTREQQVFRLMASGFGNAEIAAVLSLGESTIKSHVQHLLTKLDIPNRVHAVIYAYQHGLVTDRGRSLVAGRGSAASAVA